MATRDTLLTLTDMATLKALATCGLRAGSFADGFVRSLIARADRGDLLVSKRQLDYLWQIAYKHRRRLRRPRQRKQVESMQPSLF